LSGYLTLLGVLPTFRPSPPSPLGSFACCPPPPPPPLLLGSFAPRNLRSPLSLLASFAPRLPRSSPPPLLGAFARPLTPRLLCSSTFRPLPSLLACPLLRSDPSLGSLAPRILHSFPPIPPPSSLRSFRSLPSPRTFFDPRILRSLDTSLASLATRPFCSSDLTLLGSFARFFRSSGPSPDPSLLGPFACLLRPSPPSLLGSFAHFLRSSDHWLSDHSHASFALRLLRSSGPLLASIAPRLLRSSDPSLASLAPHFIRSSDPSLASFAPHSISSSDPSLASLLYEAVRTTLKLVAL
jgi:hypothetical protein